jgi:LacI family transcriptional regulator
MATIRDVAKESKVSVATVSYVINNGPRPVRPETRQRVLAAMSRLDYHPNAMARGLVRRRMDTLGVLFGMVESSVVVTNPFAAGVLQGIFTAAAADGYNVTLFTKGWSDARLSAPALRDRRTDGIIAVAPATDSDAVAALAGMDLPLVAISFPAEPLGVPSVDVDNYRGARLAAEHFLSLGHTRIAHLTGNHNLASAQQRVEGFRAALAAAGVACPPEYLVPGLYSARDAHENARRLLSLSRPPSAIFAGNDSIAVAVMEVAHDLGIAVPRQLSVVGFDDIPAARQVTPPLTTIRQPLTQIGETATRLLVARVEGRPVPPTTHLLEPELIVRGSTAATAARQTF